VDYRPILHIRAVADDDTLDVAANDGGWPDGHVVTQYDVAEYDGGWGDPMHGRKADGGSRNSSMYHEPNSSTGGRRGMRPLLELSAVACLMFTAACDATPGDRAADTTNSARASDNSKERPPILTSASEYALKRDGVLLSVPIAIRFTNQSADTLYLVNCNGAITPEYQKLEGTTWKSHLQTMTNACLSTPIVIAPGATLARDLILGGALPGNNAGPAFATSDVAGRYRIVMRNVRWHYDLDKPQLGDTVPMRYLLSNEFTLVVDTTR
jgi:hypothetical protein